MIRKLLASWAAGNPVIRRVWLFASPAQDRARQDEDIVLVELQPVADSEETLAVWMGHCESWRLELQDRIGQPVGIDWRDSDGATTAMPPGVDLRACQLGRAVGDPLQPGQIDELHVLFPHLDDAALLESREQAADRFERQAEVAADVLARHAQVEFGRRVPAPP